MVWLEAVLVASIVVPLVAVTWVTVYFVRGGRNDPDEQRLKRAQAEYQARQGRPEGRRR